MLLGDVLPYCGLAGGGPAGDAPSGDTPGGMPLGGAAVGDAAGGIAAPAPNVVALVEAGGVFTAVVSSPWDDRRSSIHPTMIMLTTSNATIAIAHTGNRDFGGATLTSNSAGPDCRWRSLSDFFSASRMNDIVQPP
jgi:hypothetical protein